MTVLPPILGWREIGVVSRRFLKALRLLDYPRLVGLVYNVVAVCLKEERILD